MYKRQVLVTSRDLQTSRLSLVSIFEHLVSVSGFNISCPSLVLVLDHIIPAAMSTLLNSQFRTAALVSGFGAVVISLLSGRTSSKDYNTVLAE